MISGSKQQLKSITSTSLREFNHLSSRGNIYDIYQMYRIHNDFPIYSHPGIGAPPALAFAHKPGIPDTSPPAAYSQILSEYPKAMQF
jgi:hypothetical protein